MKVEEANSILNSPSMQKANCNFKLTKQNPGKPPQWFKDWYSDFSDKLFARLDNVDQRLNKQEKFNEMVLDQFKKHKWIQ